MFLCIYLCDYLYFAVLEIVPRNSFILGKCSTTELRFQPSCDIFEENISAIPV
jgi:hypothetical protein